MTAPPETSPECHPQPSTSSTWRTYQPGVCVLRNNRQSPRQGADETSTPCLNCDVASGDAPESAAAAGGAAALADVAAAGRAHLGAAGEAQRRVGGAALVALDHSPGDLHRGPRGL